MLVVQVDGPVISDKLGTWLCRRCGDEHLVPMSPKDTALVLCGKCGHHERMMIVDGGRGGLIIDTGQHLATGYVIHKAAPLVEAQQACLDCGIDLLDTRWWREPSIYWPAGTLVGELQRTMRGVVGYLSCEPLSPERERRCFASAFVI